VELVQVLERDEAEPQDELPRLLARGDEGAG
jgi:hypothetical protein